MPDLLSLDEPETALLERLTRSYKEEIRPLHLRALALNQQLKQTSSEKLQFTPQIPIEINQIQDQEDAVALRYRDLFRNGLAERRFQEIHAQVLRQFKAKL